MIRKLRTAAIQMNCLPGQVETNLRHAQELVEQAAAQQAQLILLPELMPGGYILTEAIWEPAQNKEGTAVEWLRETAKRLQVYHHWRRRLQRHLIQNPGSKCGRGALLHWRSAGCHRLAGGGYNFQWAWASGWCAGQYVYRLVIRIEDLNG